MKFHHHKIKVKSCRLDTIYSLTILANNQDKSQIKNVELYRDKRFRLQLFARPDSLLTLLPTISIFYSVYLKKKIVYLCTSLYLYTAYYLLLVIRARTTFV